MTDFFGSEDRFGGGATAASNDKADNDGGNMAAQKEQLLRQILLPEARMRLNNIRMVKPDLANLLEQQLIGMATQGRIQSRLTDEQLKQILYSLQQPKRDFKINRL